MSKIDESMTLLDVVAAHPETEAVFRRYDELAGTCLLCQHLFESIADISGSFGLDKEMLLAELNRAVSQE